MEQITTPTPEQFAKLADIWQTVFADSVELTDLFFENRVTPKDALVTLVDGEPVAMLFLLPILLQEGTRVYDARYIYAVATLPPFRGRGISTRLLAAAADKMRDEGVAASMLVPASPSLFDFYRERGFTTEFYRRTHRVTVSGGDASLVSVGSIGRCAALRDHRFRKSRLYAAWDTAALRYQQQEVEFWGGKTLLVKGGIALCYPLKDGIRIKEWCGKRPPTEEQLAAIGAFFGEQQITYFEPVAGRKKDAVPFAMTQWYDERKKVGGTPPLLSLVLD